MKQLTPLRHLAVALLASVNPVLAAPQQVVTTADAAPLPWVTVDPSGGGSTITPKVITTQGHIATVSEAPGNLLSTAIYTLSPNGRASTYTGLAPVAAATGSGSNNEAGVFLACHVNKGVDAPFCQPRRGAALVPGRTYYVTWDPSYFQPSTSQKIQLAASWGTNNNQGSVSEAVPASVGFYAWKIPANFLSSQPGNPVSVAVSLSLQQEDPETPENDRLSIPGPTVFIVNALPDEPGPAETGTPAGGSGTNILAIVLPIILVAVLIGLGAFCFLSYRKHGAVPIVGGPLKRRSTGGGGGYGVRQSRSERVGQAGPVDPGPYGAGAGVAGDRKSETDIGVELTDRDSWSPTARSATGRNVFREEVERQERAARGER